MRRAVIRRCALCGGKGAFFKGWYKQQERCKTCGFKWGRGQVGNSLGALTMNVIATFGVLLMVIAIGTIVSYPDINVAPMIITAIVVAFIVPLIIYPLTYTVWFAIDLAMSPPEQSELDDAAVHKQMVQAQ